MSGFLLDTNVLSEFNRRGRPDPHVKHWLEAADANSLTRVSSRLRKSDLDWSFFLQANGERSWRSGWIEICLHGLRAGF